MEIFVPETTKIGGTLSVAHMDDGPRWVIQPSTPAVHMHNHLRFKLALQYQETTVDEATQLLALVTEGKGIVTDHQRMENL